MLRVLVVFAAPETYSMSKFSNNFFNIFSKERNVEADANEGQRHRTQIFDEPQKNETGNIVLDEKPERTEYLSSRVDSSLQNKTGMVIRDRGTKLGQTELNEIVQTIRQKGGLLIWKIEDGAAVLTDLADCTRFKSNETYIVLPAVWKQTVPHWNLYYWVGKNSSLKDIEDGAKYTVLIEDAIFPTSKIKREAEDEESYAFKTMFGQPVGRMNSSGEAPKEIDLNAKRMFMFSTDKNDKLRVEEVKPTLSYTKRKDVCLVYSAEQMYIHCGDAASSKQKYGAEELASILMEKRGLKGEPLKLYQRQVQDGPSAPIQVMHPQFQNIGIEIPENILSLLPSPEREKLKQFFDDINLLHGTKTEGQQIFGKLEDEFTPAQMRRIFREAMIMEGDSTELFPNTEVTRIGPHEEEQMPSNHLPLTRLDNKDCYLVNTKTNLGLYLWMGKESDLRLRMESVQKAEKYLWKNKLGENTFVTFVDEKDLPIDEKKAFGGPLEINDVVRLRDPYRFLGATGIPDKSPWSFSNRNWMRAEGVLQQLQQSQPTPPTQQLQSQQLVSSPQQGQLVSIAQQLQQGQLVSSPQELQQRQLMSSLQMSQMARFQPRLNEEYNLTLPSGNTNHQQKLPFCIWRNNPSNNQPESGNSPSIGISSNITSPIPTSRIIKESRTPTPLPYSTSLRVLNTIKNRIPK